MKPTFHHRPVNGPFEDPSVFVRLLREKRAFLFDLGTIARLSPAQVMKISDIFVTHTHIDHFIGFDYALRVLLRRPEPLRLFGPSNIIECAQGKLRGYTWDLIEEYPLEIEVTGISPEKIERVTFKARDMFKLRALETRPFGPLILENGHLKVKTANLTHNVPSLGFSLEEDYHININKAALLEAGFSVGPWLGELKQIIRSSPPEDTLFQVEGRNYALKDLMKRFVSITEGQKVSYVMDTSPTPENAEKIVELVKGSDTFYCEAYFLSRDIERARERNHLTAAMAGEIACRAGVRSLVVMHHSPKYRDDLKAVLEEASASFGAPCTSV
jgi:ribonuclease Z